MDRLIIVGSSAMWKKSNNKLPLGRVLSYIQTKGAHNNNYKIYSVNKDFGLVSDKNE